MAITVNGNNHASCDSCGDSPDAVLVSFEHDDTCVSLCNPCALKLVKAVSIFISFRSPATKRKLKEFFGAKKPAKAKRK
jgi:hypothetical protein